MPNVSALETSKLRGLVESRLLQRGLRKTTQGGKGRQGGMVSGSLEITSRRKWLSVSNTAEQWNNKRTGFTLGLPRYRLLVALVRTFLVGWRAPVLS